MNETEFILRQVAGVLANHPDRRLSLMDIADLSGVWPGKVWVCLFFLLRSGIITRRKSKVWPKKWLYKVKKTQYKNQIPIGFI
jgi:hypothetical protein